MRTIKIKLPFSNDVSTEERHFNLFQWAKALVNNAKVNVLDEKHYEGGSYMIVENTFSSNQ